jgi:hypothetical protein
VITNATTGGRHAMLWGPVLFTIYFVADTTAITSNKMSWGRVLNSSVFTTCLKNVKEKEKHDGVQDTDGAWQ